MIRALVDTSTQTDLDQKQENVPKSHSVHMILLILKVICFKVALCNFREEIHTHNTNSKHNIILNVQGTFHEGCLKGTGMWSKFIEIMWYSYYKITM